MLFLPGGRWQVPVIRLAQHMGFHVTCADGTPNAPAFEVADEAIHVELQDVRALVEIGRGRRVDAVMTEQTDFAVPLVARVAAALRRRGLPVDVAEAATDKAIMRDRAAAAGVRQPAFRVCCTAEDALCAAGELGAPLFSKPVDGQSSRGVRRIDRCDQGAVVQAFARAAAASRSGRVLFEQCLFGTECTVEGFVVDGRPTTLAVSSKEHYTDLPGVASRLTWPGHFDEATTGRIARANEAVARALGIPFGITHAEFVIDGSGEPWFVEMAARGGGTRISSHIVPAVCGFEPVPALVCALMGETPAVCTTARRAAQLRFLRLPCGRQLVRFANLDELRALPGVIEIAFNQAPGDRIPAIEDDRSRHGYAIVTGDTADTAQALGLSIERRLRVETAD